MRLISQPFVEHQAREANVPSDPTARQAASPDRLVDPTRFDVEIPSGLLWAPEPIIRNSCRWLCCRWWSVHTHIDPIGPKPANEPCEPHGRFCARVQTFLAWLASLNLNLADVWS